ncbi:hypothetical protein [Gordonia rhizosphera]|uniref:Integral membrane protein n=1 Tax=Gordonia rhizosphera NBRC 16068 TaxID=1108045 RepID=K6WJA0_9ACTN|nr:hypothetical protein [Gordonia rhizosphera]GAB92242.1 hypothetical protein GORHZ_168_00400 [Gordonia rhizosphera NBRC 16068]
MVIGLVAAVFAALAYGTASVLQAHGARSVADSHGPDDRAASHPPPMRSTLTAMVTVPFLAGVVLDGCGFVGNLVAARLLPLFLAQPIVSANLVVTAVLASLFLHVRLRVRDRVAIGVVVVSLVILSVASATEGHGHDGVWLHWTVLVLGVALIVGGLGLLQMTGAHIAVIAGLLAGVDFGVMAVAVRIVHGLDPMSLSSMLADPACYAIVVCGVGGFYLFTVALQTGSVNGAAAALIVGETVVPGAVGIALLGDVTRTGWGPIALIAFVAAVGGAATVATSPEVPRG